MPFRARCLAGLSLQCEFQNYENGTNVFLFRDIRYHRIKTYDEIVTETSRERIQSSTSTGSLESIKNSVSRAMTIQIIDSMHFTVQEYLCSPYFF